MRPNYFDAAHNLASVSEAQQDYEAAEARYRVALAMRPTDTKCMNNLGIVLRRQGKLDAAVEVYTQAIEIHSDDAAKSSPLAAAKTYSLLGNALALQEKLSEADAAFAKAVALSPTDSKVSSA